MTTVGFTCVQCLYNGPAPVKFCPRCGLAADAAADESAPVRLRLPAGNVTVRNRFAFGDVCNLYHCDLAGGRRRGVFKIARSPRANPHVAREIETLQRLHAADRDERFAPFLPSPEATVQYAAGANEPAQLANVLGYFDGIDGPNDLYSLEDVKKAYPVGIDARDMAWMWRRLLTILGFVHSQNLAHGVLTPDHVLIEPGQHKLVLIGWCAAAPCGMLPNLMPLRWRNWRGEADAGIVEASPRGDLASAARSMSWLLGPGVEPAVTRHLERAAASSDAWRLGEDFDVMIEALWGKRQFRPFPMPRT